MAEHGLLEIELEVITQVRAPKCLLATTTTSGAEDVAEYVAKDVTESVGSAETAATAAASCKPIVSVLIVDGALLRIGQDFVGLLGLFEFLFGFRVVGIAVRVVLHRQAAISLLDLGFRGRACYVEHLVVVALGHWPNKQPVAEINE